jgi:hypothetical protein
MTSAAAAEQGGALTTRDAAAYIGMSASWLRKSRMRGTNISSAPPFVRTSRRAVRYLHRDLDRWLKARRGKPPASHAR